MAALNRFGNKNLFWIRSKLSNFQTISLQLHHQDKKPAIPIKPYIQVTLVLRISNQRILKKQGFKAIAIAATHATMHPF